MSLPNILVIGGTGYIGRALLARLRSRASRITALGRRAIIPGEAITDVDYVRGNFMDRHTLLPLLDRHDVIVHLAYATVPNTSFDDPLGDLQQNLPPAVTLFAEVAARDLKLIFVSSGGTVYGEANELPIAEDYPTRPISPYGVTKLTLENYANLYAVTHGLRYVCVRPSNAYGPGQRPFSGQGFVATAMASVMRGKPVRIFGTRGTIRDYVYITDLAEAISQLAIQGELSQTYNIGSGIGRSNMDVIEAMTPILVRDGYRPVVENLPERPFDVKANVLDSRKINALTGWTPLVPFEQGLRLTYAWLKELVP